jgi:hypothetical protein
MWTWREGSIHGVYMWTSRKVYILSPFLTQPESMGALFVIKTIVVYFVSTLLFSLTSTSQLLIVETCLTRYIWGITYQLYVWIDSTLGIHTQFLKCKSRHLLNT